MKTSLFLILVLFGANAYAQCSWVYFNVKCSEGDFFDQPVCADYLHELRDSGYVIKGSSRWLNAAYISNPDSQLMSFPFVQFVESPLRYELRSSQTHEEFSYGHSDWGLQMIGLDSFHVLGYSGAGVKLAIFDAGFYKVDSFPMFDSLRMKGQILATYDFEKDSALSFRMSTHGMQVLSLLGANYPDSLVGSSPAATFLLARTEVSGSEKHSEEFNWIKAMEWADSLGVDIIHSSLGYSRFDSLEGDYSYTDMDGQSTIITLAAEQAASRGIFITNSAGNEGNKEWKFITAPCDGEHVLCVGAVDSFEQKAGFSSFGPSSDGRIKPDVMALGVRNFVPNSAGLLQNGSGTSFSGPLIAGMVACLMNAHPNRSNEAIFQAIIQSADRYNQPDSGYGYGIPNVLKADSILRSTASTDAFTARLSTELYPNPAQNYVKIVCPPGAAFTIHNSTGELILEGQALNWINFIEVIDLSAGYYTISISFEHQYSIHKLLKI